MNRLLSSLFYFLFRALSRFAPPSFIPLEEKSFERILVFSAAGIGDTLTDSVAIRALKETFPQSKIMVVTHRRRAVLAQHNPFIDEVILYHKSLFRFISLTRELQKRKPDVVVMLRGNDPDLWPMAYLVNRHAVVSCPVMTQFKFLISHPAEIPAWDQTHGVEQTLEIVRSLGANTKHRGLVYEVKEKEQREIHEKLIHLSHRASFSCHVSYGLADGKPLQSCYTPEKPIVIFQVGGGRRSAWRDWPAEYFAKLGRTLLETYSVQLILLGGADLQSKAAAIAQDLPRETLNLAGKLSLSESAALLSVSKILVSTDTGIMHLGFAVGIDTVALIHCNNPSSRVGPYSYGDKHRIVQLEPPVGTIPSKDIDMNLLSPEKVWTELQFLCNRHQLALQGKADRNKS